MPAAGIIGSGKWWESGRPARAASRTPYASRARCRALAGPVAHDGNNPAMLMGTHLFTGL